jgi:putative ATPase
VELIGWPEGRIPLAEATIYLATAPKSNAAYKAINAAQAAVNQNKVVAVPKPLRDSSTKLQKELGNGQGYQYSHDYPGAIAPQDYGIEPGQFYQPTGRGHEKVIQERLDYWKNLRKKAESGGQDA